MLSLISCLIAVTGAILLLFFKSSNLKEIKATAIFISVITLLASIFLLFPKTQESVLAIGGIVYFGSNYFSALASIVMAFLTFLCIIVSPVNEREPTRETADTRFISLRKYFVLLLMLEGMYFLLFSSKHLIISALILLVAITMQYFMAQKTEKKQESVALKVLAFRITGAFLLIIAGIFNGFVENSSLDLYFFMFGILFILPMLPVHTYLSDMFAGIRLKDGLAAIILQFVGFYMLLSISTTMNTEISTIGGFWIILALINLIVVGFAFRSQQNIYRQFSYVMVFFAGLVAFFNFALVDDVSALNTVKYLALSIPMILSLCWITINQLKLIDETDSFTNIAGKLTGNSFSMKFLKSMIIISFLLIAGVPFTPIFNSIIKSANALVAMDYRVFIFFIPLTTTFLLILLILAFLIFILNAANTLQKLYHIKKPEPENTENNSTTMSKEIILSRNYIFIAISLLILIVILSILPVFIFRKLQSDTQKIQNVSSESQARTLEIKSSEGLNEK